MRKPLLLSVPLLALVLWQGGALTDAPHPDGADDYRVTSHYTEVPVLEILADLGERGGISYAVAADVPNWPVSAVFRNVKVNDATRAVLDAAGLNVNQVSRHRDPAVPAVFAIRSGRQPMDPESAELRKALENANAEQVIAQAEHAIMQSHYGMLELEIKIAELEGWMDEEWGHQEDFEEWLEEIGDETVQWLEEIGFFGEDDDWLEELGEEEMEWLEEIGAFDLWDEWDDDDDWDDEDDWDDDDDEDWDDDDNDDEEDDG